MSRRYKNNIGCIPAMCYIMFILPIEIVFGIVVLGIYIIFYFIYLIFKCLSVIICNFVLLCKEYTIEEIDRMNGFEFERFAVNKVLFKMGFKNLEVTQKSGDYGIDIIGYKNGIKFGFQCKRHKEKIGVKAVQEAIAGEIYYNCSKCAVITNSYFTNQAIKMAKRCDVLLIDRKILSKYI